MVRDSLRSYLFVALLLISPAADFAAEAEETAPAGESSGRETGAAPESDIAEHGTADSVSPDTDSGEDPFREEVSRPSLPDPLEPVNRALFVFNDKAYFWVMKPVAQGYRAVVPEVMRISVRNFFSNLAMPIRFVNNLLQGKIRNAGVELLRFALNTTAGIGGFFDPAKDDFRLVTRDEDLGQTFGTYGFGHGLYIVLPLLGPSSLRDAVGQAGDSFLDPLHYVENTEVVIGAKVLNAENEISLRIGEYEELAKSALDPYVAVRDAYSQYREKKVRE